MKKKDFLGSISIAFLANLISMLGSTILTLVLPKYIGVTQYSYYQLYIFYVSYIGFLGIGWIEGVYLRYGGQYYDKLNKSNIGSQLRLFSILEFIIGMLIGLVVFFFDFNAEKNIVFFFFCLCIIIYLPRAFLHNLLQTTGRVKEYAQSVILEKIVQIILTIIGLLIGKDYFVWYIASELVGRLCAAIYIFYVCKDIVRVKAVFNSKVRKELYLNITSGLALMISNVASMLVIGVIRQAIEIKWSMETFGKISLTLSISNLLMTFINSVALVLFPMLKRSGEDELSLIYDKMRTILMLPLLGMLIFFYPVKVILSAWLPQYGESLAYMAVLFPMCVYECKMALLINTYLKTLRKEKVLLIINLVSVFLSVMLASITCFVVGNLDLTIFSIVLVLAIRCVVSELILSKYIEIHVMKDIILEVILTVLFIIASWFVGGVIGVIIYAIGYLCYILINRKKLIAIMQSVIKK